MDCRLSGEGMGGQHGWEVGRRTKGIRGAQAELGRKLRRAFWAQAEFGNEAEKYGKDEKGENKEAG